MKNNNFAIGDLYKIHDDAPGVQYVNFYNKNGMIEIINPKDFVFVLCLQRTDYYGTYIKVLCGEKVGKIYECDFNGLIPL